MSVATLADLEGMDYVPLAVVPLALPSETSPSSFRTALYAFTAPPYCWLDIGTPVHLHLSHGPVGVGGPCRCPRNRKEKEPLAIRGWVVAESARTKCEVEYVVTNEEKDAAVQRAVIRFKLPPNIPLPPNSAELDAQQACDRTGRASQNLEYRIGRGGPAGRVHEAGRPALEPPEGRLRRILADDGKAEGIGLDRGVPRLEPGPMTMKIPHADGAPRSRWTATQPYAMIEAYGRTVPAHTSKAVEDGIWNYGRPIMVRARERTDGLGGLMGQEWRHLDSV